MASPCGHSHGESATGCAANAVAPSSSPAKPLQAPLLAGRKPKVEKVRSKCESHHHEPGHCHGFEVHKSTQWISADHYDIEDCGVDPREIERKKRRNDIWILAVSAGVMAVVMVIELTSGFLLGSLALLSDGVHYASDVALYTWLLSAVLYSERNSDVIEYSFGYHRAEVIGALVALLLQYFAIGLLVLKAIERLTVYPPNQVSGPPVCAVGAISLAANAALLRFTPDTSSGHGHSHGGGGGGGDAASVARLHVLGDVVQGVAVIITGIIDYFFPSWTWADPSSTFVYAFVLLGTSRSVFRELLNTLMERAPPDIDAQVLFDDLSNVKGVIDVHCFHCWALGPGKVSLSAHMHIEDDKHEEVLHAAQIIVKHKYGIAHSTLQISEDEDLA